MYPRIIKNPSGIKHHNRLINKLGTIVRMTDRYPEFQREVNICTVNKL